MKVDIYQTASDGSQEKLLTYSLINEQVTSEGDDLLSKMIEDEGIKDYSSPDCRLFPRDGIRFLENLKHNYNSGYFNATDILE